MIVYNLTDRGYKGEKNEDSILLNDQIIKPASKHCNDVILSYAKNLAFSCCYEILHSVQDDNFNCRVNNIYFSLNKLSITLIITQ
jgi:hypothetical protein